MNARRIGLVVCCALAVAAVPALATELGDEAPPLKVEKWLKGGPVDLKAGHGKNVFVVEFWATWCGPCRMSIPHLTELQQKYKDQGVVIIGVSTDEAKKRQTRDKAEPFVKEQGDKMNYAVALDDEAGSTNRAYQEAFMVDGIPNAFVIDKSGKIVWQGHPMALDAVLDEVLAGKWDLAKAKKEDAKRRVEAEKQAKAFAAVEKYLKLVSESDKPEGAEKAGQEALAACGDNAGLLNEFAWTLLTEEEIKFRDLKFAMKVAKAAFDACKGENAAIVDTYARALFDTGQIKEAIEFQRKAVKLAGDNEEMRKELEDTLKRYEAAAKK